MKDAFFAGFTIPAIYEGTSHLGFIREASRKTG
jgi:hypothetical protein